MGLQLIFVVETNKKCNSDWIYIKDTIEHFYQYERTQIKLSVVYMDGKGKYKQKEKQINQLSKQYNSQAKNNHTKVMYCFDCDNYDTNLEDLHFLETAKGYCDRKGYEFVWFCKDIEQVFIGHRVSNKLKQSAAVRFKRQNQILEVDKNKFLSTTYKIGYSNMIAVLDKIGELNRI